jgi:lipoate-protein ligase B
MILACRDLGVKAGRSPVNHGIWVGPSKIGSIGLTIRQGISFHGMALNVAMDLEPFSWINPCGLKNLTMTSLEQEIQRAEKDPGHGLMARAREAVLHHFSSLTRRRFLHAGIRCPEAPDRRSGHGDSILTRFGDCVGCPAAFGPDARCSVP